MERSEFQRYAQEAFRQMDEEAKHPAVERLAEYSAGDLAEGERREIAAHLAECGRCRRQLEEFEQFAAECRRPAAPPADLTSEWRELRKRIWLHRVRQAAPQWGAIAAAIAAAIGLAWAGFGVFGPPSAERLLAQAYEEQRGIEFRVAGAKHAPLRMERGGGSAFALPPSLLEAQAKLGRDDPNDPDVLRLKGEAELLAREAGAAVQTLKKARDLRPNDARILAVLGVAYALRGGLEQQPADYPPAIEALTAALKLQPHDLEAVFNRALVLERMLIFNEAVTQWEAYLQFDSTSGWAAEARQHLAALKPKVKAREGARIVDDPAAFLTSIAAGGAVDAESYLREVAIVKWLPQIETNAGAREAVQKLAAILSQKHRDAWMTDLLASADRPAWTAAMRSLATARAANQAFNRDSALPAAQEARAAFQRSLNPAGELWARFEQVVALKTLLRNDSGLAEVEELIPQLDRHSYSWLRAQARIEAANCAMRLGRLDEGAAYLVQAQAIGLDTGLGEAAFRAAGIYLDHVAHVGLPSELFAKAHEALEMFWSGNFPVLRYYQVVDRLRDATHESGDRSTSYFLARSAIWAIRSAPVPVPAIEAAARAHLAAAALFAGETAESRSNIDLSDRIFAQMPGGSSSAYYLEPRILLASAELERGETEDARGLLERMGDALRAEHTVRIGTRYWAALGDAYRRAGMFPAAIDAFRKSVEMGAERVGSLGNERERAGVLQTIETGYRGLVSAILASPGGATDALRAWQSYRALDKVGNPRPSSDFVGKDPTTLLTFVELPDGYAAWLSLQDRVVYRRLACSRTEASVVIKRFLREASDSTISRHVLEQDSQQLYQWMIQPFEAELEAPDSRMGDRVLALELDGVLTGVPVQALMSRDRKFLSDRFTVLLGTGLPAASVSRFTPQSRLLIVANPAVGGAAAARFPPLTDTANEIEAARAAFRAALLLEGHQATAAALITGLPESDIVHFAGHGYATSEDGALLLAAGNPSQNYELLRSMDLSRQDWSRCRLVVLSACATAAGEAHGAHNPDSLVRALSRAGAANVAASLWSVDSAATSELMKAFYAALAAGSSPAHALRQAQQTIRRRAEWSHPYYWAGFQLYATT